MTALLFLGIVFLVLQYMSLSARVTTLEQKDKSKTAPVQPSATPQVSAPVSASMAAAPAMAPVAQIHVETPPIPVPPKPPIPQPPQAPIVSTPDPIMVWLSENTLIKIGAFFFFLGAAWFVSYAISEGWLSPLARILSGILLGIGVSAVGFWRKKENIEHYLVLTTLGVGIVIASIYAGQFLFQIFSPSLALVLLVMAIAYAVWVSLETKTEWLCVASAITSLVAPLLVNAPSTELTPFFLYLFAVSVAFSAVVFFTHWRSVTLTFVVGVTLAQLSAHSSGLITDSTLWIFVLLFAALFFSSATISMFKSNIPEVLDITSLGIVSVAIVWWMKSLTEYDALFAFGAGLICTLTGYLCYVQQKSEKIIAVYTAFASVFMLIATSFAFDGFTLTLVYTLEIAIALILVMKLRLSNTVVGVVSYAFLIPVCVSSADMLSSLWTTSALHPSAYALYALTGITVLLSAYSLERSRIDKNPLYQTIGVIFLMLFWVYAHICAWLVCDALFNGDTVFVLRYVSWTLVTLVVVAFTAVQRLPKRMFNISMISFAVPILTSLSVLNLSALASPWDPSACGLYFMTLIAFGMCSWLTWSGQKNSDSQLITAGAVALIVGWLYAVASIYVFWGAIPVGGDSRLMIRWFCWSLLSMFMVLKLLALRAPSSWIPATVATFGLSVLASLFSLASEMWQTSWTHTHAIGLYAHTLVILMAATVLYREAQRNVGDMKPYFASAKLLFILFGLYVGGLIWLIAGAVFSSDDVAVSVALLIYTIGGLCLYTIGRTRDMQEIRYAGIILLTGVVARLLLVDVWRMEILGRVVTFLGVGLLFILTALFEKPFDKFKKID